MPGTSFVALYRGESIASARLVAVSADPQLVVAVSAELLTQASPDEQDPVGFALERGRRAALRAIQREATDANRI
ncbi:MAG: hypothetical protein M3O34_04445 [Chloroflexota bacterium]|nr:hypothetical protein [Chloroflexota bacterium]